MKRIIMILAILTIFVGSQVYGAPLHPRLKNKVGVRQVEGNYKRTNIFTKSNNKRSIKNKSISIGNRKVLVLMINFSNKLNSVSHNKNYFDNLIFSDSNSMKDYYKEVSYDKLKIEGTISDWVTSSKTMEYYGNSDNNVTIHDLVNEAIDLSDSQVNFADYDSDNDGFVDHLIIVHSGEAEEFTGINSDIWSHSWEIPEKTVDGVKLKKYTLQAEDSPLGIFAHEFGHDLGLWDLYNTDNGDSRVGSNSLMDHGLWNGGKDNDGTSPAHPTAWEKIQLNWIYSTKVTSNGTYTVKYLENNDTDCAFKINLTEDEKEYLLIENRKRYGYDGQLPGSGILIYHIYESDINGFSLEYDMNNNSLNNHSPLRIKILEADGTNDIWVKPNYGNATDYFSSNFGYTQLLSYVNNNSNTAIWDGDSYGISSGIDITEITQIGDSMKFKIRNVAWVSDLLFEEVRLFRNSYFNYNETYDYNADGVNDLFDLNSFKEYILNKYSNTIIW